MTRRYLTDRIGPSIWLALLPLSGSILALPAFLIFGNRFGYPAIMIAMLAIWLLTLVGTIRHLKRHWVGAAQQPTWSLVAAGVIALLCWGALMNVSAPWQDHGSLPEATPAMVLIDIVANFGPLGASAICSWVFLVSSGRNRAFTP
jgi:hypothetical protein